MKKIITIMLIAVMLLTGIIGCSGTTYTSNDDNNKTPSTEAPTKDASPTENAQTNNNQGELMITQKVHATIEMMDGGIIELELYPEIAPQSVYNFVSLAKQGYYDGLTFHRVISGFMIQGGDPKGDGTGGPGYHIKGEFAANGFENNLLHTRGVISFARSRQYDSAGSQFFIMHQDAPHLDGNYAAFGKVIEGMDVVDRIASVETNEKNRPVKDVVIKSITVEDVDLPEPDKLS